MFEGILIRNHKLPASKIWLLTYCYRQISFFIKDHCFQSSALLKLNNPS